jgi:hypothetical protein
MIVFYGNGFELDLTLLGITLNEENNMFIDNLIKSYSFPFRLPLLDQTVKNLGFPNIEAVSSSRSSIKGKLLVDNTYYPAKLRTGDIQGEELEVTLYYGDEELPVYGTKLANLPWPINIVTTTYNLAQKHLTSNWPDVTHNFPMVYKPSLKEKTDYQDFQYFANNYDGSDFEPNVETTFEGETSFLNKNVLMPCPYLLEMVKFGYLSSGRKVRGGLFNDDRLKKMVLIPNKFLEKFRGSTYDYWQFSLPDSTGEINLATTGIYKKTLSPSSPGTYNIKFNINIDPVRAEYFYLRIYRRDTNTQEEKTEYSASSLGNRVNINKEISINILGTLVTEEIIVEMHLMYNTTSIKDLNSFEYSHKEGRLNELDTSYSLAEIMPDITFGEFMDRLKNWLNLDISVNEEFATIDFLDQALDKLPIINNEHLEVKYPRISSNADRTFRLTYADDNELLIDRTGIIYSDLEKDSSDIVEIDMEVRMAVVEENYGRLTAVDPEDESGLTFAFYDGKDIFGRNPSVDNIDGFTGKIEDVHDNFWKKWLFRRTRNKTIKDRFVAHYTEGLKARAKAYKYNQLLLPQKIRMRRISLEHYDVEIESETI